MSNKNKKSKAVSSVPTTLTDINSFYSKKTMNDARNQVIDFGSSLGGNISGWLFDLVMNWLLK